MNQHFYYQQGDLILKRCGKLDAFEVEYECIPKDAEETKDFILLRGSTNSHGLYGGKFKVFKKDNVIFVRVDEATKLDHVTPNNEHAEHHAQWIEPGEYFVDELLEYDHTKEESRRVID